MKTDTNSLHSNEPLIEYGTFGLRLGALFIDSLLILPFILFENLYNIPYLKSELLLSVVFIFALLYKPFTEYYFGATVGKMILRLKVVNSQLNKPTWKEILFRNIFHITPIIIGFSVAFITFSQPEFSNITSFREYSILEKHSLNFAYQFISFTVIMTDSLFLLTDKKCRALHDRIARTFIIRKPKNSK